jgi:hypothetical protein
MPNIQSAPTDLYTLDQLTEGFDPTKPRSILRTLSFRQYQGYYPIRKSATDLSRVRKASIHDAHISEALYRYLQTIRKRPIGFMGGHGESRSTPAYEAIARLARVIAQAGFLVVSGGGPGIMEAAHAGAFFANASDAEFDAILLRLAATNPSSIPHGTEGKILLNDDGTRNAEGDPDYVKALFNWYLAADNIRKSYTGLPGDSLAVSTWQYGEEPVMPFATAYAAYFENSIREQSLVRESRAGIVYGRGKGGTVREIFQDVEENFGLKDINIFTPMILFDLGGYWNPPKPNSDTIKLDEALANVFSRAYPPGQSGRPALDWPSKCVFETDHQRILDLLNKQAADTQQQFAALIA